MPNSIIEISDFQKFFEDFTKSLLEDYIGWIERGEIEFSAKEVNDPVWGTITLSPFEVAILDSPLVQRLRGIRQLGVVHWVYPGAIHTRFEHTLGVVSQAQNLINALNSFPTRSNGDSEISRSISQTIRLAALLHDVGHACFSHVSEKAMNNFVQYQVAIAQFNREKGVDKSQLSEIAAYYMIQSSSFRRLLDALFGKTDGWPQLSSDFEKNKVEVIDAVSKIVISKKFSDQYPTAQDLISGPFDADKIDYLMRDALYCGVPNVVDTSRLVQKLQLVSVPEGSVPKHLQEGLKAGITGYRLFGIKASGARVLDELVMARTFLYSKVYRHQKVQAIEAMVEALFRAFAKQIGQKNLLSLSYHLSDEEILSLNSENFQRRVAAIGLACDREGDAATHLPVIGKLTSRIKGRRLFSRVMQLESSYPGDPHGESEAQKRNLIRLNNDLKNVQKLGELKDKLVSEINWITQNAPNLVRGSHDVLTDYALAITPPSAASGNSEVDRALILHKNGQIDRFGETSFNSDAWSSAYDYSGAAAGFIFSDLPYALVTYLAAEKTLYESHGVIIPSSSVVGSKVTMESISEAKKILAAKGYYRSLPIQMRPVPNKLEEVRSRTIISEFCEKIALYQGPTEFEGDHVIEGDIREKVTNWLKQFERDELVDIGLQVLERFKVLSRGDVVQAAKNFFAKHGEFQGGFICGFGSLKDSTAIVSYFANDLAEGLHGGVHPVEEARKKAAATESGAPIVFFDDIIASGCQASDLLSGWFGDDDGREDLGEERLPLHEDTIEFLKGRKLAFLFVAGWEAGKEKLEKKCASLGLDATVYIDIPEDDLPFAFENCDLKGEPETISEFKQICNNVGEQLLQAKGQEREKFTKRGLGYGNRAMLLALPYNVPTQTLTCLRERGPFQGAEWQEIFLRRQKK